MAGPGRISVPISNRVIPARKQGNVMSPVGHDSAAVVLQRMCNAPSSVSPGDLMTLQRAVGNQALGRLLPAMGIVNSPVQREAVATGKSDMNGMSENRTGLPERLKAGMEGLSGFSLDDVRVHYASDRPEQVGAVAFTQGTDIHMAPGQERHLPHETWHVVQQKQGRVRPTFQLKGVHVNDDQGLEQEADVMGRRAADGGLRFESNHVKSQSALPSSSGTVIQRVGNMKIDFEYVDDKMLVFWGRKKLGEAMQEMRIRRRQRKAKIWKSVDRTQTGRGAKWIPQGGFTKAYGGELAKLDDEKMLNNTKPFVNGTLKIDGDEVKMRMSTKQYKTFAVVKRGKDAFKEKTGEDSERKLYNKAGKDYVKDDLGVFTPRFAYVEKNIHQFMEFLVTRHMEGRFPKLFRAKKGREVDLLGPGGRIMQNDPKTKLRQLAYTHQRLGSGDEQRGISLTSTSKKGRTIANEGDNFRTDGGVRIKIDLSRISNQDPIKPILINHYSYGGVKGNMGGINQIPSKGGKPYKYKLSVIKNRELFLSVLKPEWIAEVEFHPAGSREKTYSSDGKHTNKFFQNLRTEFKAPQYQAGFWKAGQNLNYKPQAGEEAGVKLRKEYENGYTKGIIDKANKNKFQKRRILFSAPGIPKNSTDIYKVGYYHALKGRGKIENLSEIGFKAPIVLAPPKKRAKIANKLKPVVKKLPRPQQPSTVVKDDSGTNRKRKRPGGKPLN